MAIIVFVVIGVVVAAAAHRTTHKISSGAFQREQDRLRKDWLSRKQHMLSGLIPSLRECNAEHALDCCSPLLMN